MVYRWTISELSKLRVISDKGQRVPAVRDQVWQRG